jgi:hypothetical protein
LDTDIPFIVFLNHGRHCLFQYLIPGTTRRQEWDPFDLLDKKSCTPTGTPIALDDPADALNIRAIA